jgi:surface antigen
MGSLDPAGYDPSPISAGRAVPEVEVTMSDRNSRWLALAGLAGFLVVIGLPAYAGNLDFLSQSPVSYFNDEDMRLLKETVTQVLDDKNAYAKKSWSNPATGNSGQVESRGAFKTAAGVTCKRVRVTNHAKAVEGQGSYIVCQDAEKGWAVDQAAKPG